MAEPTTVQRRGLAKLGLAMPDGSYYIRNGSIGASDLDNAIKAVGRGQGDSHDAIRKHVMKRAKALGLSDKIPADWQADGSLKHGDELGQQTDNFLKHFGITGMRWGYHLPGVEVLGGSGNGDGGPSPFIQRGDHTGDKPGQDNVPLEQQANRSIDALNALRDHVAQATEEANKAADAQPPGPEQDKANAVLQASQQHLAQVTQLANKAKAAQATHKATVAKITKQSNKAQAKKATHAAAKLHAAHMNHLAKVAHAAHAAHKAHVANLKVKTKTSQLTTHDKAALAKLSPVQRSALKKLTPQQRATLNKMTPAQKAKLAHLTQAEKTALSHLSPKQKEALAKATAASAKKRHNAAMSRKTTKPGVVAAKQAAAKKTATRQAAVINLVKNAQNGSLMRQGMDDPVGTFLEHFGVKGMKWGVRRNGGHSSVVSAKIPANSSSDHQQAALIRAKVKSHGGVHALSNDEIRALTDRLNLEANYHRLHPQTGKLDKGRKFVKTVTSDAKTVLDAVDTGRRVVKLAQDAQPSGPSHQSHRTRNKPLKVVSVN